MSERQSPSNDPTPSSGFPETLPRMSSMETFGVMHGPCSDEEYTQSDANSSRPSVPPAHACSCVSQPYLSLYHS